MIEEPLELPVFIIKGPNWNTIIKLDEQNSQFVEGVQMEEAASRAVAAIMGKRKEIEINLLEGESPVLETMIFANLVGSANVDSFFYTHILLANEGLYKESWEMEQRLNAQALELQEIMEEEVKKLKSSKPKKIKKKTTDNPAAN